VEIKDVHYLRENGRRDQLCLLNVQQQWGFCKCELKRARGSTRVPTVMQTTPPTLDLVNGCPARFP
jgi:hypothetical protein